MSPTLLMCLSLSQFGLDESLLHELNLRLQYPDVATRYIARLRESHVSGTPLFRRSGLHDPLYDDDAFEKFLEGEDESTLFIVNMHEHFDAVILDWELRFMKHLVSGKYEDAWFAYSSALYFGKCQLQILKKSVQVFALTIKNSEDVLAGFQRSGDEKNAMQREMALKRLKEAHAMLEARIAKDYPLPIAPAPRRVP